MKLLRKVGSTSEIWQIFVRDSSSSTGSGLTGLTNASSGLTAYYHRDTDTTETAISLVSMTVGTFTSGGFKEISATNMPGWYQFCPPNAALASGAKSCAFHLKGATNMTPLPIEVDLDGQADVTHWNGTAVKSPTTAGVPEVCITDAVAHGGTLGSSTATLALSRMSVVSQSSNTDALTVTGNGTGDGVKATGGATGNALELIGGGTSGDGLKATTTSGHGFNLAATGAGKHGLRLVGGNAVTTTAAGHGLSSTGGTASTSSGGTAGNGFNILGGSGAASTNGAADALAATGGGTTTVSGATGFNLTGTGNLSGFASTGAGSGNGALFTGGITGNGFRVVGGSNSGYGFNAASGATGWDGMAVSGIGTGTGLLITGGTTGHGMSCQGGTAADGIHAFGGTSGSGIASLGGSTGNAISLTGGGTSGHGLAVATTSGDGFNLSPTAGHGVNIAANGTSKHGLFVTGGTAGTSDGIKAVAGTGGVDIRGNITGNLTGTVATTTTVTNQLTAAQIATGVWQDATAGDFTTASSIGKSLYNSFTANTSVFTTAALANAPTGGSAPTVGQIATAVWQDTTAGDFTTAGSIGKSLYTSGNVPGAASGLSLVGSTMVMDQTQTVSMVNVTSDTTLTVGKALLSARAQAGGAWTIVGTTLTIKNPDGTTFRTFTLDSATTPTSRT